MPCPNCHQTTSPGAAFCGNCGYQLNGAQAPQPPVAPQPQTTIAPAAQPVSPATPLAPPATAAFAVQPAPQPSYVGSTLPAGQTDNASQNNGKATAAFVMAVLGCVGWLIPLVGVILGILALIFGTLSLKSRRRVLAIIGIVLAVPVIAVSIFFWVRAAQQVLKNHASPLSGLTTSSTSQSLQTISSPCYTTKIPANLTVTQTAGSCTFRALNSTSGEEYEVKVLQIPQLSIANLAQDAQTDAKNIVNATPGGSISDQQVSTFSGSPAYTISIKATDGSAGTIDYIYDTTLQGNLVIVFHAQRSGAHTGLATIENNWSWQ